MKSLSQTVETGPGRRFFLFLALLASPISAKAPDSIGLTRSALKQLKNQPCVLIHPWATWCTRCINELPGLLTQLESKAEVQLVVLDISSAFAQKHFSRKWVATFVTRRPLYFKPPREQAQLYQKEIDSDWNGALPYSVLYRQGKKIKAWAGSVSPSVFAAELPGLCR